VASLAILRHAIPTKRPYGIACDLAGTGTSWSGSTAWSVSGVSGCSIVTHIVTTATVARLVIATGSATGTLTVSDGTHTATVQVWDAALQFSKRWFRFRR
jgi:hypothetical protein